MKQHCHGGVDLEYNNNHFYDLAKSKILDAWSCIGRRWHVVPITWLLVSNKHTRTINQLFMIKCPCSHNIVCITKYPHDCNIETWVPSQGWNCKHVNYTTKNINNQKVCCGIAKRMPNSLHEINTRKSLKQVFLGWGTYLKPPPILQSRENIWNGHGQFARLLLLVCKWMSLSY